MIKDKHPYILISIKEEMKNHILSNTIREYVKIALYFHFKYSVDNPSYLIAQLDNLNEKYRDRNTSIPLIHFIGFMSEFFDIFCNENLSIPNKYLYLAILNIDNKNYIDVVRIDKKNKNIKFTFLKDKKMSKIISINLIEINGYYLK